MHSLKQDTLQDIRANLLKHRVYSELDSADKVRVFMQYHVFAVWDFMSLLKRLQQLLTVTTVPWMPGKQTQYARFINEIVLGEETDEDGNGGYVSHFELYLQAMEECGADVGPIHHFLKHLQEGSTPEQVLQAAKIPQKVQDFVNNTLQIALHGEPYQVAAAFFFGREDIIPDMFTQLVREIEEKGEKAERLLYYLNRHIELDSDQHGPLAEKLLVYLCADDSKLMDVAKHTAEICLNSRIHLWDGVLEEIAKCNLNICR